MKPEFYLDGKRLDLAKRIGKGGEGEVYLAAKIPRAVKIYTLKDNGGREAKVQAMVRHGLAERFALASFPEQVVREKSGKFAGFTMRFFEGHRQIHDLYGVKSRKINFPGADYRFLLRAASNSARAVAQVHNSNCIIGDLNHSGILVSEKDATVSLIDADSFQFEADGRLYPCLVGVPEFTAPELQGKSLGNIIRSKDHDNFALAIAVFQLLFMGRHPYAGRLVSSSDLTLDQLIARNLFAYARSSRNGASPPVGVATLNDMPGDIASAFERAFGVVPAQRPSAPEWVDLLQKLEGRLSRCSVNSAHFYPSAAAGCTWCKMEAASPGTVLFLSNAVSPGSSSVFAGSFDIERAWSAIAAIPIPDPQNLLSKHLTAPTGASQEARAAKAKPLMGKLFGILMMLAAPVLFFNYPDFGFFWFVLLLFGWFTFVGSRVDESSWIAKFRAADRRYSEALDNWRGRLGIKSIEKLRSRLAEAVIEFRGLDQEKTQALQRLQSTRKTRQLHEYLDKFLIKNASISGVGPARTMALASYGIESAADVQRARVLNVPGFGPATTDNLIAWRASLERRFVYNPSPLPSDAQARANLETQFANRRNELIKRISEGQKEMAQKSANLQKNLNVLDPNLAAIAARRTQVQLDLQFLGISIVP